MTETIWLVRESARGMRLLQGDEEEMGGAVLRG